MIQNSSMQISSKVVIALFIMYYFLHISISQSVKGSMRSYSVSIITTRFLVSSSTIMQCSLYNVIDSETFALATAQQPKLSESK